MTTNVASAPIGLTVHSARVRPAGLALAVTALLATTVVGLTVGAVPIPAGAALLEVIDHLPLVDVDSGLTSQESAIVWQLRFPRVVLGLAVGGMLALAGASYQGVFRNPLADPFLLGAAAGAGLGATIAVVTGIARDLGPVGTVPLFAFAGALIAVACAYLVANVGGGDRSTASLLLAGVAVAAFFTAAQTYLQQRNAETLRELYAWLLGSLGTGGWADVHSVLPYLVGTSVLLLAHRRSLDVLSVGDEEAAALGLHVRRTRLLVVSAASLATAAAVSVSGLIGFVGIVVPHVVRLLAGTSYRIVLPLSLVVGATFLAGADMLARTAQAPAEVPIGVITAFLGAPFFVLILRARGGSR